MPSFRFHKSDQDTLEEIPYVRELEYAEDELTIDSTNTFRNVLNIQGTILIAVFFQVFINT